MPVIMKFLGYNNFTRKSCEYYRAIDVKIWQFIFDVNMCLRIRIVNCIEERLKKLKTACMLSLMEKKVKMQVQDCFLSESLREKRPSTELFLVRIFLYSVRIQENTNQK